jgi:hypothetical protein
MEPLQIRVQLKGIADAQDDESITLTRTTADHLLELRSLLADKAEVRVARIECVSAGGVSIESSEDVLQLNRSSILKVVIAPRAAASSRDAEMADAQSAIDVAAGAGVGASASAAAASEARARARQARDEAEETEEAEEAASTVSTPEAATGAAVPGGPGVGAKRKKIY